MFKICAVADIIDTEGDVTPQTAANTETSGAVGVSAGVEVSSYGSRAAEGAANARVLPVDRRQGGEHQRWRRTVHQCAQGEPRRAGNSETSMVIEVDGSTEREAKSDGKRRVGDR